MEDHSEQITESPSYSQENISGVQNLKNILPTQRSQQFSSPVMTVSPAGLPTSDQSISLCKGQNRSCGKQVKSHQDTHLYISRSEWALPVSNIKDKRSPGAFRETTGRFPTLRGMTVVWEEPSWTSASISCPPQAPWLGLGACTDPYSTMQLRHSHSAVSLMKLLSEHDFNFLLH